MFNIRFYNEIGSVDFGGGGADTLWKITKAEGLAFCGRSFVTARYAGKDGQETCDVVINPRIITLCGDVRIDDPFNSEIASCLSVFEQPGTLEISTNFGKRTIDAKCCEFVQGDRKGKYVLFTVQFVCDDPYFEDADRTEIYIYKKIPLLDGEFVFPGMFSKRITRTNIQYAGTCKVEPVFFISVDEGRDGENLLIIKNHTSGESLTLNYGAVMGECITVDVKNRKIYNQEGENLLKYLSDDSFFDGFHLCNGDNDIEVINRNSNTGITVSCCFANRYSEAVYI